MDRGYFDYSKALIKVKIPHGFLEIFESKKREKATFFSSNFPNNRTQTKTHAVQKIINVGSSIYDKIFRLLSFQIKQVAKLQVAQENTPWIPIHLDHFRRF